MEQGLETDLLDGVLVAEYPSEEDFVFPLCETGEHKVQAFAARGRQIVTPVFEGTYVLGAESGVRKFDISEQEGSYDRILEMEFVNTQDGWVQYTTDGTDPLRVDSDGEVTLCYGKSAPRLEDHPLFRHHHHHRPVCESLRPGKSTAPEDIHCLPGF